MPRYETAFEIVSSKGIDISSLDFAEQSRLKFRLETGGRHDSEPKIEWASDDWEGKLTNADFGAFGARTAVTVETPDTSNTSWWKPIGADHSTQYTLSSLAGVVELYGISPLQLEDLECDLPVPVRDAFNTGTPSLDGVRLRDYIYGNAYWGNRPDVLITHPPWRIDLTQAVGTPDTIYDKRENGEIVSLNPKYRGRW